MISIKETVVVGYITVCSARVTCDGPEVQMDQMVVPRTKASHPPFLRTKALQLELELNHSSLTGPSTEQSLPRVGGKDDL